MNYDINNKNFNYYCNIKDIPYFYLESVAKAFVIKFDCKNIYIDYYKEIENNDNLFKLNTIKEADNLDDNLNNNNNNNKLNSSVFANFKKNKINIKSNKLNNINKKCNIYIYKGKIDDYHNNLKLLQENSDGFSYLDIDYNTFKKNN